MKSLNNRIVMQSLWLFSHDSRFKITMKNCNCDIWITQCTHKRRHECQICRFSIPEWGEEVWLVFWHADWRFIWDRISIRKCVVRSRSSAPQITIQRSRHSYDDFAAWFERCVTGKHLQTIIWIAQFKIWVHTVQNTVEPRYNEDLGTMKITLLYQVSHYIRVKKKEI